MKKYKGVSGAVLLAVLMAVTFYVIFREQDISAVWVSIRRMHKGYLALAALIALFFVSAEGILIWYMLRSLGDRVKFASCLRYAFTGFFYAGITPSASGGQPMQLYYMSRDGHGIGDSTVVLLSAAVSYKLVLVLMGAGIALFWFGGLSSSLGGYLPIFFLGLFLNAALVAVLLAVMCNGPGMERFLNAAQRWLVRLRLLRPSGEREENIHRFVGQYQDAVAFLKTHVRVIAVLLILTFVQRCSVFALTYFVYRGLGLEGTGAFVIMALQAVVYISVDMLPLPGSQGITEIMYAAAFRGIFTGGSLMTSLCVSRGLNFYMPFFVSGGVALYNWLKGKFIRET